MPDPAFKAAQTCLVQTRIWLASIMMLVHSITAGADEAQPWLLVDTTELTVTLMASGQARLRLDGIAIGRHGASAAKLRGDNTTPLGEFRVNRIDRDSRFHRFIGLSYPDPARARAAHVQGSINDAELAAILDAHRRGEPPPQGTVLGGHIGIHGLGRADPGIHAALNWTRGCVALTDTQVDALLQWVRPGMRVEIR